MEEEKKKKPFYQRVWFFALVGFIVVKFVLPDSEAKEYRGFMDKAEASFESGDISETKKLVLAADELRPDGTRSAELLTKIKLEEKKLKKQELKTKEKKEKQKKIDDRKQEVNKWINSFPSDSVEKSVAPIIFEIFDDSYTKPSKIVSKLDFDKDEKVLDVLVKGNDGWSDESIGEGFYMDSTAVYKNLVQNKQLEEIWLGITFPMKDTYGKVTEEEEVMGTWLSRETMNKINWDSFNYQKIIDVADGKTIYPQFVQ